jgi:hypothetical protein
LTDASGRFQFQRIPPGEYKLLAWEDVEENFWQDPDFIRKYDDRGRSVRIDAGTKENFEIRANPPGR